jgi:hypothetical protein
MIERRRAIRYPLQLPASFVWEGEGISRQDEGHTRNISENGAFVDAAILPPIGSSVELHFSLPALSDSGRKMHVRHMGKTLRLEGAKQGKHSGGFAITSHEVVWSFEDENNFDRSKQEED